MDLFSGGSDKKADDLLLLPSELQRVLDDAIGKFLSPPNGGTASASAVALALHALSPLSFSESTGRYRDNATGRFVGAASVTEMLDKALAPVVQRQEEPAPAPRIKVTPAPAPVVHQTPRQPQPATVVALPQRAAPAPAVQPSPALPDVVVTAAANQPLPIATPAPAPTPAPPRAAEPSTDEAAANSEWLRQQIAAGKDPSKALRELAKQREAAEAAAVATHANEVAVATASVPFNFPPPANVPPGWSLPPGQPPPGGPPNTPQPKGFTPPPPPGGNSPAPSVPGGGGAPAIASMLMRDLIGAASVATIMATIHANAATGEKAVHNVADPAAKLVTDAYDAGLKIGHALLSAALQPFGASGAAVADLANQAGATLGRGLRSVLSVATNVLGTGGKLLGGAIGVGGALAGMYAGGAIGAIVGNLPGAINGALAGGVIGAAVGLVALKIVSAIASALGGLIGAIGSIFGQAGELATSAFKTVLTVLQDIVETTLRLGRAAQSIHNYTGASLAVSSEVINQFKAVGIKPQDAAAMFQGQDMMPAIFRQKAAAFGIPTDAANPFDLRPIAQRYRDIRGTGQNPYAVARANDLLTTLFPQAPPELFQAVNMPAGKLDRQLDFGAQFRIPPDVMSRFTEDVGMLQTSLDQFVQWCKVTLAGAIGPALQKGLEVATHYVIENRDAIIDKLFAIADFFVITLPTAAFNAAEWVTSALMRIAQAFSLMLKDFASGKGIFHDFGLSVADALDTAINGFNDLRAAGIAAFEVLKKGLAANGALAPLIISQVGVKGWWDMLTSSPLTPVTNFYNQHPQSNLRQTFLNTEKAVGNAKPWEPLDNLAAWLGDKKGGIQGARREYEDTFLPAYRKERDNYRDLLKENNDLTRQVVNNTGAMASTMTGNNYPGIFYNVARGDIDRAYLDAMG